MSDCLTASELAWYVTDGLSPVVCDLERADRIEAHAAGCADCAGALAAEARAELVIDAAATAEPLALPRRRAAWLGALAAVAGIVLVVFIGRAVAGDRPPPRTATAADSTPADAGIGALAVDGDILDPDVGTN